MSRSKKLTTDSEAVDERAKDEMTADETAGDEMPENPNLLELHNGNVFMAVAAVIDCLSVPRAVRVLLKVLFFGVIIGVLVCAVIWPFFLRIR